MQRLIVLTLLIAALALLIVEQHNVGRFQSEDGPLALDESLIGAVSGGYAGRRLSRRAARVWGVDAELARQIILAQALYYPLDADQWLNLARVAASRTDQEPTLLSSHLNAAVAVNAGNRNTLWRAAQIAIQAEDYALAEQFLYRWALDNARRADLVLMTAGRWLTDPEVLIERVLPEGPLFLAESMQYARRQGSIELAEALWKRADTPVSLDDRALLDYMELLGRSGRTDQAIELWARYDPYYRPGGVANGSFDRALGKSGGLNWQTNHDPDVVDITRDEDRYHSAPASLLISFKKKNVRLGVPRILVPVTSTGTYRLSGYWRGEGLTTRSLPFLTLDVRGTRQTERLDVPASDFDWSPWSMTVSVPPRTSRLVFRLRRQPTEAFDRYIEGDLWLDSIELTRIEDPAASSTAAIVNDTR
jgi:hypothetical protein